MRTTRNENGDYTLTIPVSVSNPLTVVLTESEIDQLVKIRKEDLEKSRLEVGKWYTKDGTTGFLIFNGNNLDTNYGFYNHTWADDWTLNDEYVSSNGYKLRPATEQEVKEALVAEAEKRGFVKGVNFLGVKGMNSDTQITIGKHNDIAYNEKGLYCGNSYILFNGTWATIIPIKKYTLSELEQIVGHKFEIV